MSTAAVEAPATPAVPAGESIPHQAPEFGSKGELHELVFGGIDEADIPADERPETDDKPAAEAKANDAEAKPEEKKPEVDEDAEAIKEINRRSAERRKAKLAARNAAQSRVAAPAKQTEAPAAEAKPEAPKAEPALTPDQKLAADATRQVLEQIARLAGGDEEAAAEAAKTGETPKVDPAREALANDIKAKVDGALKALQDGVGAQNKKLTDELKAVKDRLEEINSAREVRDYVAKNFIPIEDKFPTLSNPASIRAYNKEHGTAHTSAIDLIHEALSRTFEKHGYAPKVRFIAEAIEKKLAAKSPENTEKTKPSRTLSSSLGSPPAARTSPDDRTYEEAQADFNRRWGLDT